VLTRSILFGAEPPDLVTEPPPSFPDLNLDQFVGTVTQGRDTYELAPFLYTPLDSVGAIEYRHEVFHDLERREVRECVTAFAVAMRATRERQELVGRLRYAQQRRRWFLDAARIYCDAVARLRDCLVSAPPASRGLRSFHEHLDRYVASAAFEQLDRDEHHVRTQLDEVRYTLEINGSRVKVARSEGEEDYGTHVAATFEKFKQQHAAKKYRLEEPRVADMNHVEAGVLDRVALLYPETFGALEGFCARHADFVDPAVAAFDREVQFYVAYLELADRLRAAGLPFCYPSLSEQDKTEHAQDVFDIALAAKLVADHERVVTNDFELGGGERVIVVSGPNQGGKTTFARTIGQLHHLAALGCPVPGRDAALFLCDRVCTHFEKEETLEDLSGKLQDDLLRVHEILDQTTSESVVILNEIFTSTSLSDAAFLGTRVLETLIERGSLCVCVSFVEELAALDPSVVSMVAGVDPDDVAVRTFKVVRRPPDGLAYAVAIAEKYGLTYERLKERIAR
jgi:DNA mismatch repair protein MutS